MNTILKLEEVAMFAATLLFIPHTGYSYWLFAACFFLPDIGMLGYLLDNRTGAATYNFLHHKGIALVAGATGLFLAVPWLTFTGLVLFSHASFDRIWGYGLKYEAGFGFTHLGRVGKSKPQP